MQYKFASGYSGVFMIESKRTDGKIALENIEELKKEINLKERADYLEENYFTDRAVIDTNSFVEYNFESIDKSILMLSLSCLLEKTSNYELIVTHNDFIVFYDNISGLANYSSTFSCVLTNVNNVKIFLNSAAEESIIINLNLIGKFKDLVKKSNFLTLNDEYNKYRLTQFGNYSFLEECGAISDIVEECNFLGEKFKNAVDMKVVNSSSSYPLILASSSENDYLYQYKIEDNISSGIVTNLAYSDATIIPVLSNNFSYLVAVVLDGMVKVNYYLDGFTPVKKAQFNDIKFVDKISCAVDLNNSFNHIVLSYIDNYNNCYICGSCNYDRTFEELSLNTDKVLVGKGKLVSCYVDSNNVTVYLNDGYNNITKTTYAIVNQGGGYFFKRVSSHSYRNVDQVFLVGNSEVVLKNGMYRVNE